MSKALTTQDPALLKQWQERTNQRPKNTTNKIELVNSKLDDTGKLNPDYGKLFEHSFDENGEEHIEEIDWKKAEFFLAKVRMQIKHKQQEGKPNYWVREVDSPYDPITIMDNEGKEVATGFYKDLKEEFNLKYTDAAYVWYKGKVYRWVISGAHFESWFPLKSDAFRGEPHTFKITGMTEEKTGSVFYKVMHFEKANPFPVEDALKILDGVNEGLARYYASLKKEKAPEPAQIEDIDYATDLPFDKKD